MLKFLFYFYFHVGLDLVRSPNYLRETNRTTRIAREFFKYRHRLLRALTLAFYLFAVFPIYPIDSTDKSGIHEFSSRSERFRRRAESSRSIYRAPFPLPLSGSIFINKILSGSSRTYNGIVDGSETVNSIIPHVHRRTTRSIYFNRTCRSHEFTDTR